METFKLPEINRLAPDSPPPRVSDAVRSQAASQEARNAARAAAGEENEVSPLLERSSVRARWKIEITYGPQRTVQGPNAVGIQVWESGKHFHGGGDALAFFCKDNREGHDEGCWGVIPQDNIGPDGIAYCPHCERTVNAELLVNMRKGYVTSQNLALELATIFRRLNSDADLLIKYHMTDPRYIAMERAKGPDVARRLKGMHMYRLAAIIRDVTAGADIVKRFHAFVTS